MIRHIVMFKLDKGYTDEEKLKLLKEIHVQLMALKTLVEELKSINVYTNSKKASQDNYDLMLDTTFDNFKDLDKYQKHPDHQKVVSFMKSLKLQRSAIDFEI